LLGAPVPMPEASAGMVLSLAVAFLYVREGVGPRVHQDVTSQLGQICLHIVSAAMALCSIAIELAAHDFRELPTLLRNEEAETSLNASLIVLSLAQLGKVWKSRLH
jgi:hypothetical protein